MKKRILTLGLLSIIALTGCNKSIKIDPDKEKYVVGIAQFAPHVALDAATNGFKAKLSSLLAAEGRQVEFEETNASGDLSLPSVIVNSLLAKDVDLIMANATPCVSAAYSATSTIPILGTSVTDYGVACDLKMEGGKSGTNLSGTSDLAPLGTQVEEMLKLLPRADKFGILYCSSEANSKFQVDEVSRVLREKGKTVNLRSFVDATDLQAVCLRAASEDDAIYIPTDNTAAQCGSIINSVFASRRIPVYAGEEGICKAAGIATLSIDYFKLGEITGEMAFKVLLGKEDIREYAIKYDEQPVKKFNKAKCEDLGIEVPSDYVELGE